MLTYKLLLFQASAPTKSLAVTAAASTSVQLPGQGSVVRIINEGPNIAFVSIGSGTQTATLPSATQPVATSTAVLAGTDINLLIDSGTVQSISAICRAAGTALLSLQVGEGA